MNDALQSGKRRHYNPQKNVKQSVPTLGRWLLAALLVTLATLTSHAQTIGIIDTGSKIPQKETFDIRFDYTTSVNRRAVVSIKKPSQNWATYATTTVNLTASTTNRAKCVTLSYSTLPALGTGYVLEIKMINQSNNNQVAYKSTNVEVKAGKQGFHTWQGKLYNSRENQFLIRGVNSMNADWDNYNRFLAYDSIPAIAAQKFNTIRIQWRTNAGPNLSVTNLDNAIARAIQNKLIPIVQLHDVTGSANPADLTAMANWWADHAWLLVKYRPYILVNIANEWSPWGTTGTAWLNAYNNAISIIRNAGFSGTLVVDAPAYAQDPNAVFNHGQQMINADPRRNLVFSLHTYAQWGGSNPDYSIADEIADLSQIQLPFIIGEFAQKHPDGNHNWVNIDFWQILRSCKDHGVGYVGWAWKGNGSYVHNGTYIDLAPLDISTTWNGASFTSDWGHPLINWAVYGVKATSVVSTQFNGSGL